MLPCQRARSSFRTVAIVRAGALASLALVTGCASTGTSAAPASPSPSASSSSTPAALFVAGLGDSVMSSTSCGCADPASAYASLLGQREGRAAGAVNLGGNGETAEDLARELVDDSETRSVVHRADVVLVIIGANDVAPLADRWTTCPAACWSPTLAKLSTTMSSVLSTVDQLRRDSHVPVLVSNYWNVLQDGQEARDSYGQDRVDWSLALTEATNKVIAQQAQAHGATLVDVDKTFHGTSGTADATPKLLDDGDHPNAAGVKGIAQDFLVATPKQLSA